VEFVAIFTTLRQENPVMEQLLAQPLRIFPTIGIVPTAVQVKDVSEKCKR
jgi:hypothetical protein